MRTLAPLVLLAALWCSTTASADPYVTLKWDSCGSSQINKSFTGPAVYRQVISAAGFSAVVHGYELHLHITASNVYDFPSIVLPDAWRFDRPSGCQAERLALSFPPTPCPVISPGQNSYAVGYDYNGYDLDITLFANFDPVQPDPSAQYTLFALDYDHSRSATGPRDPATACGGADQRVCFVIREAYWNDANWDRHPMYFEPFWGVSWQDPGFSCFGDLAIQRTTWTTVKTLYR